MKNEVHLVEVDGFLYAGLPSGRSARFRKKMEGVAELIELVENAHVGTVYRLPVANLPLFEEAVCRYYPNWGWRQWGWLSWGGIPPWAREALMGVLATSQFTRLFGGLPGGGEVFDLAYEASQRRGLST